jgi:hypothetical protein
MTTATDFRCLHCDATSTASEITAGWCDSCGKRLPDSYAAKVKLDAAKPKPGETAARAGFGGKAVLALLAVVAVAAAGVFLAS